MYLWYIMTQNHVTAALPPRSGSIVMKLRILFHSFDIIDYSLLLPEPLIHTYMSWAMYICAQKLHKNKKICQEQNGRLYDQYQRETFYVIMGESLSIDGLLH